MSSFRTGTEGLTILGGGIAGLATAYYAHTAGLRYRLFEARDRLGGNCITFRDGPFAFDSGAHRLHDKDPGITADMMTLLGSELREVNTPSKIYDNDRLLRFPFSAIDLLNHLGANFLARGGIEIVKERLKTHSDRSFEGRIRRRYGRSLSQRFLLNYSEKLWGMPCTDLAPSVTGGRLKGLDWKQFVFDSLNQTRDQRNMEGRFFYPRGGIGTLTDALRDACYTQNLITSAPATRIMNRNGYIHAVEISGERIPVTAGVISTIPLSACIRLLDPPAPDDILSLCDRLIYRDVILAAVHLKKEPITDAGTIYFPDRRIPFTRIIEPRNRCSSLSPPGHTSLVAELPCPRNDSSPRDDTIQAEAARRVLVDVGWIDRADIVSYSVRRLSYAYPVLTVETESMLARIHGYLSQFTNLSMAGRTGMFRYSWMHDHLRVAKNLAHTLST